MVFALEPSKESVHVGEPDAAFNHLAKISTTRDEIGKLLNASPAAITKLNPNQPSQDIDKQDFRFIRAAVFIWCFSEASLQWPFS
ncbi:hypothetical protein O9992_00260 [Vibrio lentus]|nr:hypothetical protein [Vibrio lentus]